MTIEQLRAEIWEMLKLSRKCWKAGDTEGQYFYLKWASYFQKWHKQKVREA